MPIDPSPFFVDLDKRRPIEFNLNTERMIFKHKERDSALVEVVEEIVGEDGKPKVKHDINLDNLAIYLWAAITEGARIAGEPVLFTIDDVGALVSGKRKATNAYLALRLLMARYYGDAETGKG